MERIRPRIGATVPPPDHGAIGSRARIGFEAGASEPDRSGCHHRGHRAGRTRAGIHARGPGDRRRMEAADAGSIDRAQTDRTVSPARIRPVAATRAAIGRRAADPLVRRLRFGSVLTNDRSAQGIDERVATGRILIELAFDGRADHDSKVMARRSAQTIHWGSECQSPS